MIYNSAELSAIYNGISFSKEEAAIIGLKLERIDLKKGDTVLRAGDIVLDQYFVYSGCLRAYSITDEGKEHTLQFAIKDWWISDYTAFFSAGKAIMNIECIADARVYKISKKQTEESYVDVPRLETFFRKKLENAFAAFQKRTLGNLAQTAKERYVSFIYTYPNIEQSVKNYHIASYLGITTESLSRVRKELAQK